MQNSTDPGRRAPQPSALPVQLHLFDVAPTSATSEPPQRPKIARPLRQAPIAKQRNLVCANSGDAGETRVVAVSDLPAYPAETTAAVERTIKSIPTDRVLLCYKEIQDYFGVSKSNVIRRMRAGLVPGVRLHGRRLVEEGPIRKLDREQIRWLLLSLRARRAAVR